MQRGSAKSTSAQHCADGLYLLFDDQHRPDRAAMLAALSAMPDTSVSHDPSLGDHGTAASRLDPLRRGDWLELLKWGMTFDCLGLAPGPGVAFPPIEYRFNCPVDQEAQGTQSIALVAGPHLADAANSLPVVRAMLEIGAELVDRLEGIVAVGWGPARSAIAPAFFSRSVHAWIAGGPFPALGMVGFASGDDGALRTDGLGWFIGQELELTPALAGDRVAATRLAARLIHELVSSGAVEHPSEADLGGGLRVRLDPFNETVVRVSLE